MCVGVAAGAAATGSECFWHAAAIAISGNTAMARGVRMTQPFSTVMVGSLTERSRGHGHDRGVTIAIARSGCGAGIVLAAMWVGTAAADDRVMVSTDEHQVTLETRWPSVPLEHGLKLEDKMVDRLSEIGSRVGDHLDAMSHDCIGLSFDARRGHARLRFGGGDTHFLSLHIDSNWHFIDGKARVQARLQLGLAGHMLDLQLPDFDVRTDSYHGAQMVDVNVPLFERKF
jgi:hypothetical protein